MQLFNHNCLTKSQTGNSPNESCSGDMYSLFSDLSVSFNQIRRDYVPVIIRG